MSDFEPLRKKIIKCYGREHICKFDNFTKEDVASAVRFYMRYKDNPCKLMDEEPEHYKEFMKNIGKQTFLEYCFGDVIE